MVTSFKGLKHCDLHLQFKRVAQSSSMYTSLPIKQLAIHTGKAVGQQPVTNVE